MKHDRLSIELLAYIRATQIHSFKFDAGVFDKMFIYRPADIKFELQVMEKAIEFLDDQFKQFSTTLDFDKKILEALNGADPADEVKEILDAKQNQWRFKLAVIHRVN